MSRFLKLLFVLVIIFVFFSSLLFLITTRPLILKSLFPNYLNILPSSLIVSSKNVNQLTKEGYECFSKECIFYGQISDFSFTKILIFSNNVYYILPLQESQVLNFTTIPSFNLNPFDFKLKAHLNLNVAIKCKLNQNICEAYEYSTVSKTQIFNR